MKPVRYLTDGTNLFEIAAERVVQNYGAARGLIRYVILRDCVTEETSNVDSLYLQCLEPVQPLSEAA